MSEEIDSLLVENVKSVIAGGVGGVAAVLTGHPFDLVKVNLQSGHYPSAGSAVRSILKTGGPLGFYKGVVPPLVGVTPMFAVSFWGYDVGKTLVGKGSGPAGALSTAQVSAAGFLSAIPTTLVAAPFERVKIILQTQAASEPKSMLHAVKKILRTGGLRSLFKGSAATLARDGPGSAVYFATYEVVKAEITKFTGAPAGELSLTAVSVAGGLSGVAMWLAVFPIDTIKTFMTNGSNESLTTKQAIAAIHKRGGVKGFFPGIGPALCRSFPANAATFVGVELTHKFFKEYT